jgi:two-component system, NarL family, sensor histidine kinase DesK
MSPASVDGFRHAGAGRWPRVLLVAMHVPAITLPTVFTLTGGSGIPARYPAALLALVLSLVLLAIQLRHSLAAARDVRPPGWPWTLVVLAVLVYGPMPWFSASNWSGPQVFVIASGLMLLRGWMRLVPFVPFVAAWCWSAAEYYKQYATPTSGRVYGTVQVVNAVLSPVFWFGAVGVSLYAAARLVRVLDELRATRSELADLAVRRERLRVSRDLHDLLGQSLSAISLKGDLALRLLDNDPPNAQAEIESLTRAARTALRGLRGVTQDEHQTSLFTEISGAASLLAAAGIDTTIAVDLPSWSLAPRVERALSLAVREGVTNILHHSDAQTCSISVQSVDGSVRLDIINDLATPTVGTGTGTGLAGLTERAEQLSAVVTAGPTGDGRFQLIVEIPQEVP